MGITFKAALAIGGTLTTFLVGDWHISLGIFVTLMVLDYITGIAKGMYNKELRSRTGFRGVLKKSMMLVIIILANMLDLLVGGNMPIFRTMAVFFLCGTEAISIVENLGAMGVKLPKGMTKYIQQLVKDEEEAK